MTATLEKCALCGSAACLLQSPRMCRHTRIVREDIHKELDSPPEDKQMKRSGTITK